MARMEANCGWDSWPWTNGCELGFQGPFEGSQCSAQQQSRRSERGGGSATGCQLHPSPYGHASGSSIAAMASLTEHKAVVQNQRRRRSPARERARANLHSTAAATTQTATSFLGIAVLPERCPVCGSHVLVKTRRGGAVQLLCAADRAHDVSALSSPQPIEEAAALSS